jgi:hypothetical protein
MEGAWILLLLLQLQPYESSAPDGMVTVGILERAIDRQALCDIRMTTGCEKQRWVVARRDITVGKTAFRADRLCGSISNCKVKRPLEETKRWPS